jgi:ribosome-binding factor A
MKKSFSRADRVKEQIRRDLADILRGVSHEAALQKISLTDVELTPDYAFAKIFYTTLFAADLPEIEESLKRANGFLRRELGKRIHIHTLPQLRFAFDDSLERGAHLSALIEEAAAMHAADADETEESTEETKP